MKKHLKISIIVMAISAIGLTVQSQNRPTKNKPGQSFVREPVNSEVVSKEWVQGVITVKLKKGIGDFEKQTGSVSFGIQSLDEKVANFGVYQLEKRFRYNPAKLRPDLPDLSRIYKISFPENFSISEVAELFSSDPNVEYAEAIPVYHTTDIPNDALLSQMHNLPQIHAPEAWTIHKGENGTEEIIIAINDTGVDWDHEDLQSNVWQNLAEDYDGDGHTMELNGTQWVLDPGDLNGIDDDGNGFTDDLIGWNFITGNSNVNPIPGNPMGFHGTHCAGIAAGATDNGIGIASISWNLKFMPICADANNTLAYGWDGIIYAAENGADFISNSWGGGPEYYSMAAQEVVTYAAGLGSIVLAAAGNDNYPKLFYPADYHDVISVASVSADDTKAGYSNYNLAVDISAPGGGSEGGILSTYPGNLYQMMQGTSMACPLVAGCFGLLKSYHPDWSNDQLITQVLGTADNIDSLNPDYTYMLGSGRVNAFRMLSEENVMPFLKLELISVTTEDENGNSINEPGEIVTLSFNLFNHMPCYGSENVTASLLTDDPDIAIINGSNTVNIPPDSSFSIVNQLQIQVGANASCHFANLTLHFESEIPIPVGQDINFKVLVNPSGILVFEGEENGQDYSGKFITSFLDHLGYGYTYSNTYSSLLGFETVFLSYRNSGENFDLGTPFTLKNFQAIQEYLESGGNLYVEAGGMFYEMVNVQYPNIAAMKPLFGLNSYILSNIENPINALVGGASAPTQGMLFTASDQASSWHIDKLNPKPGAIIPFTEQDYGNVAIMNEGSSTYGQKTFYMGYSLAKLLDMDAISSRYNILLKIMEFFGYSLPQGYILANFITDKITGGPPFEVQFTDFSLSDPAYPITSWQWDFENDGTIDSYDKNPVWTYNNGGDFTVKLIVSNGIKSDTLIMDNLITVNYGYLVYEGVADGNDYSGTFIRDYLQDNAYAVTYRNDFPEGLEGFSAAFLSFGNYDSGGTEFTDQMADIIIDYLEGGGYVYLEGGDNLGYYQVNNSLLHEMFGVASAEDGGTNPIDNLEGQQNALTNEMLFTGNSQVSNSYIDKFVPSPSAWAAFTESDYGIVAVQQSVPNDRRTFCFSYAIANLNDGEMPNTREELLHRILNFFDIYTAAPAVDKSNTISCIVYPNPLIENTEIHYYLTEESHVTMEIYNSNGQKIMQPVNDHQIKGTHNVHWNAEGLPAGVYHLRLKTGNQLITKKIIKIN
jgi:PKD repeat protein